MVAKLLTSAPLEDHQGRTRFFVVGLVTRTIRLLDLHQRREYFIKVDTTLELASMLNWSDGQWETWISSNKSEDA